MDLHKGPVTQIHQQKRLPRLALQDTAATTAQRHDSQQETTTTLISMADAVGLGGLHDLGFYVCDLCQEQCQQNEELNALGEGFGEVQLLHALPGHEMRGCGMASFRAAALHLGMALPVVLPRKLLLKCARPGIQASCFSKLHFLAQPGGLSPSSSGAACPQVACHCRLHLW